MPSMPKEYTPEMNQQFFDTLARPINERTDANVGKARGEALARGLEGDPFEASGVNNARNTGSNQLSDLWSGINMKGADAARQERLTTEGQDWTAGQAQLGRDFSSSEADKNRAFQERMTQINYDNARGMEALNNRRDYQSAGWNTAASIVKGFL